MEREEHAARINEAWQKSVDAVIETGLRIIDAREGLDPASTSPWSRGICTSSARWHSSWWQSRQTKSLQTFPMGNICRPHGQPCTSCRRLQIRASTWRPQSRAARSIQRCSARMSGRSCPRLPSESMTLKRRTPSRPALSSTRGRAIEAGAGRVPAGAGARGPSRSAGRDRRRGQALSRTARRRTRGGSQRGRLKAEPGGD